MSWLSKVVRPKLRELVGAQRDIPDNLWQKCPACAQLIFHRDLEKALHVCPHCGHHMRLGVERRLANLFDGGVYRLIDLPKAPVDPLRFRDVRKYTERLKEAQTRTGHPEAICVAVGSLGELPAVIACLDFAFMGGSMGVAVGEGLLTAARAAVSEHGALIVVSTSGGARMQEGILSLMQMARTTIAVNEVREAGLPYLVVLADPTTGGVSASFAMLGDITLAEPGAVIGFAGARVIEQTIRESLPEGFQKAEYLLEHGMVDMVVPRHRLAATLARILRLLLRPAVQLQAAQPATEAALPPPPAGGERFAPGMSACAERDPSAILTRLQALHPRLIDLSLDRVYRLLQRLGNPHTQLPPVVHVAGTNGKGSTVAFLQAMLAAHGRTAHAYTSPHLVRFNERIVAAGRMIDDQALATLLTRCEAANDGAPITFFEITTAAALLAFAEVPADFTLLETGLGGRLDATNVVDRPALTVLTPISIDHRAYLGDSLAEIAFEKAGILKSAVTCVVATQPPEARRVIAERAEAVGAPLVGEERDWSVTAGAGGMRWRADGYAWDLPAPALPGAHQRQNAGVAIAALHRLPGIVPERERVAAGLRATVWPARLQRLASGSLAALLPADWELWLDGGHNPGAAAVLAAQLRQWRDRPCYGVIGMLQTKDAAGFVGPLAPLFDAMAAVAIPNEQASFEAEALATLIRSCQADALACHSVRTALTALTALRRRGSGARVLICGSLYLAGHVLAENARG